MELNSEKKISQSEFKILQDQFSIVFKRNIQLCNTKEFYKLALEFSFSIEIPSDVDLQILIDKIGHNDINDEDEVFLMDEIPNKIYKYKWGILKNIWEEMWSPPGDDMIIIYIPNKNFILITHWDMVYYHKVPNNNNT